MGTQQYYQDLPWAAALRAATFCMDGLGMIHGCDQSETSSNTATEETMSGRWFHRLVSPTVLYMAQS